MYDGQYPPAYPQSYHHGPHPVIHEKLHRPRTVFAPGQRIRMNIIPMFLNLVVPWTMFVFCCGITSFQIMYTRPGMVYGLLGFVALLWLISVGVAIWARRYDPEPTWFSYLALSFGIAALAGTLCGMQNFKIYSQRYYELQDLKVISHLDVSKERGSNVLDAGIVYFANGNRLDGQKSWHFKHQTLYCVAPVVANQSAPTTQSYDFWAVGKDCCSISSSDFRCGPFWGSQRARAAIRVLDDRSLPFYRLAVKQAETLYGIMSSHPVFFTWSQDPLQEVNSWNLRAFKNFLFLCAFSFVVSLFCLAFITFQYAWIGRRESAYEVDIYSDPMWRSGGYRHGYDMRTGMYGSNQAWG